MTNILPETRFIQKSVKENRSLFEKLADHLKSFIKNLKSYFNSLGTNPSREAQAVKEQIGNNVKYLDSIVKKFDELALTAVENFQSRVSRSETAGVQEAAVETENGQKGHAPEAEKPDEKRAQKQARDYSKATKNTTDKGDVPKNMKRISINRYIIPYEDKAEQWAAIDSKAVDLVSRGKVISLTSENVLKYKDAVQWKDKKAVREFLRTVLASDQGVSVYFEYDGQLAIAYLTSHGIKHAVGGYASPRKAAAFEAFRELVKNAEYTFSSPHDAHRKSGKICQKKPFGISLFLSQ